MGKSKSDAAPPKPTVFVVEDDPIVTRILRFHVEAEGYEIVTFQTAEAFLKAYDAAQPGCLVLDVCLPGMDGPDLQQRLAKRDVELPIIMISANADLETAVDSMEHGALTFLPKPLSSEKLKESIKRAIELDLELRERRVRRERIQQLFSRLTVKEKEVLDGVLAGRSNSQMAKALELSVRAIEDRRARLMRKLGVDSIVELVRLTDRLELAESAEQ